MVKSTSNGIITNAIGFVLVLLPVVSSFSIRKDGIAKAAATGMIAFGLVLNPVNINPACASTTNDVVPSISTISNIPVVERIEKGEQIFLINCAACHAGGQNVIMPEKTLEKQALDMYLAGGRNTESIRTQVTNGKNAMPAFGGRLSDEDIANVAAYVINTSEEGWEFSQCRAISIFGQCVTE